MNKPTQNLFTALAVAGALSAPDGVCAREASAMQELVPLSGTVVTQSGIEIVHSAGMPLGEIISVKGVAHIFQGLLSEVVSETTGSGIQTVADDCDWLRLRLSDDGCRLLVDVCGREDISAHVCSLSGKMLSSHVLHDGINDMALPSPGEGAIIISFADKSGVIKSFKLITRR